MVSFLYWKILNVIFVLEIKLMIVLWNVPTCNRFNGFVGGCFYNPSNNAVYVRSICKWWHTVRSLINPHRKKSTHRHKFDVKTDSLVNLFCTRKMIFILSKCFFLLCFSNNSIFAELTSTPRSQLSISFTSFTRISFCSVLLVVFFYLWN